jgi:hypothetical protein
MNSPLSRNLRGNREVSLSAYGWLFSELVYHAIKHAKGIRDLETCLTTLGSQVGVRVLELFSYRLAFPSTTTLTGGSASGSCKRELRLLGILNFIHNTVWKGLFGKPADSLEKSAERKNEYMIYDDDVVVNRFISIPAEYGHLNCGAFVAGIIEGILRSAQFVSFTCGRSAVTLAFEAQGNRV